VNDLASLVTGSFYLVLCDFWQFVINICDTGAMLCDLVQHNQRCLCLKSFVSKHKCLIVYFIVAILTKLDSVFSLCTLLL